MFFFFFLSNAPVTLSQIEPISLLVTSRLMLYNAFIWYSGVKTGNDLYNSSGETLIEMFEIWYHGAEENIWAWKGKKWQVVGAHCLMRSFIIWILHHTWLEWSNKGKWEDGASNTRGRDEKYTQNFSQKPEGGEALGMCRCRCEDNIKIEFVEICYHVVDLVHRVRDRNQSWAVVSTVVNILFHKGHRITWLTKRFGVRWKLYVGTMKLRKARCYCMWRRNPQLVPTKVALLSHLYQTLNAQVVK